MTVDSLVVEHRGDVWEGGHKMYVWKKWGGKKVSRKYRSTTMTDAILWDRSRSAMNYPAWAMTGDTMVIGLVVDGILEVYDCKIRRILRNPPEVESFGEPSAPVTVKE